MMSDDALVAAAGVAVAAAAACLYSVSAYLPMSISAWSLTDLLYHSLL